MTRVILNGTIKGLRGRMGDLIFRQLPDGTTLVTGAPYKMNSRQKRRAKLKRSAAQNAHNDRFQEVSAYARRAAKAHPIYAELAAVTPMKTAYNFAVKDWFHPPVNPRIERDPGCIRVEASDEVLVSRVQVAVLNEAGEVLETVDALRSKGNWWEFATSFEGQKVVAKAWDLPGNHVTFTTEKDF